MRRTPRTTLQEGALGRLTETGEGVEVEDAAITGGGRAGVMLPNESPVKLKYRDGGFVIGELRVSRLARMARPAPAPSRGALSLSCTQS
jgi:hypothetical protein